MVEISKCQVCFPYVDVEAFYTWLCWYFDWISSYAGLPKSTCNWHTLRMRWLCPNYRRIWVLWLYYSQTSTKDTSPHYLELIAPLITLILPKQWLCWKSLFFQFTSYSSLRGKGIKCPSLWLSSKGYGWCAILMTYSEKN